jgi:CMP-N,N'-diacetyllegionaminic acid synthase
MGLTNQRIVAIIPARGGSKGLPGKNIYPLNGKPLIAYSIEASLNSKYITKTVVSSEDNEILGISEKYGSELIKRPKEFATDSASSDVVIKDCLEQLEKQGAEFDILILLQPTSPLRNSTDIDSAFEEFYKKDATALISVYEPEHTPFKSFKLNKDGFLEGLVDNNSPFMRRQDLPRAFMPNGAIYIIYVDEYKKSGSLFTNRTLPFVMSLDKSADVDNISDIARIEEILKLNFFSSSPGLPSE